MNSSEEKKDENEAMPTIRTMQTDAQTYIKQKNLSPLDIAAKTYAANPQRLGIKQPRSLAMLIALGTIALAGAGAAGWWFFFLAPAAMPAPPQPKPPISVIRTDGEIELALSSTNLRQFLNSIEREQSVGRRAGSLVYLPIVVGNAETKQYISAHEFFRALEMSPPQSFFDVTLPTFYLFAYKGSERGSLVFVFRTNNFERAFSSLLSWGPMMPKSFRYFISQDIALDALPRVFTDKTVKNHDARVLLDHSGSAVLAYALFDKNFVIIATSEEALAAALERMIAVPPQ